jgi:thiol-disulfide isomerase/thioredoxin
MNVCRLTIVLAAALLLAAVATYFAQSRSAAPSLTYTTVRGEQLAPQALHGKVVLVNFWATTCAVCRHEMPEIVKTYRAYGPRGFEVIAVAMPYDRPDWVLDYVKSAGLPFRVALDYDAAINRAFGGIDATPTGILIDKKGRIVERILGQPDFVRLDTIIERELNR